MKFVFDQKVLFKHCDPAGIVFYPRFFEMMNDCIEAFFDHIGVPFESFVSEGGVPTVEISTTFLAPSRHGDHLSIAIDLTRIGTTSVGVSYLATCGAEERFRATQTLVNIDAQGRPLAWPTDTRNGLAPYLTA